MARKALVRSVSHFVFSWLLISPKHGVVYLFLVVCAQCESLPFTTFTRIQNRYLTPLGFTVNLFGMIVGPNA